MGKQYLCKRTALLCIFFGIVSKVRDQSRAKELINNCFHQIVSGSDAQPAVLMDSFQFGPRDVVVTTLTVINPESTLEEAILFLLATALRNQRNQQVQ